MVAALSGPSDAPALARLAVLIAALAALPVEFAYALPGDAGERMFVADVCDWENFDWYEMLPEAQQAWSSLGWTQRTWDAGDPALAPRSDARGWAELSANERSAAIRLGYDAAAWDADKCRGARSGRSRAVTAGDD